MFKLYKDAFKVTNDGIILTIPLAVFAWIITMYVDYSRNAVDTSFKMILSFITILFMCSAFCSGWFYMIKKCIKISKKHFIIDNDKNSETLNLLKAIPRGVGRFFLYYVETCLLFLAIALLMVFLIGFFALPLKAQIDNVFLNYGINVTTPQEMKAALNLVKPEIILEIFNKILIPGLELFLSVTLIPFIFSYLIMLWMPEIIYTYKNPLIALFTSIKKLFTPLSKSIKLYIFITFLNMIIYFISPLSLFNPILYMAYMIFYFYSLVYIVVLIFLYYDTEFNNKPAKHISKA
jgi:hypothetical protein